MTKFQRRSSTTDTLELEPRSGHRYELKDIAVNGLASGAYLDIYIGGKSMCRIYGNKLDMITLGGHGLNEDYLGFFELIRSKRPDIPLYNSAQDEKLTLKYSATPTINSVYFNDLTGIDVISHTLPGASDGFPTFMLSWVTHSKLLNATGEYAFDVSLAPTGLPTIKDEYTFAGLEYELFGLIFASTKAVASSPTFFRIFDYKTPLFDDSMVGFRVHADNNELKCDVTKNQIFILPESYKFLDRSTIRLLFSFSFDGTNTIASGTLMLGLLGILTKPV